MANDLIQKELNRIQEDCEYSAKGHFESAKYWRIWNCVLMICSIVSLCACLVFTFFDLSKLITGGIGSVSGFITILLIFLNPQEKYLSHQNSGNDYLKLRNKTRIFSEHKASILDTNKQIKKLEKLNSARDMLNKYSLPIATKGYRSAKKQIEILKTSQYRVDKHNEH